MNTKKWIENNCEDLTNRRVVLTGATGGLGREICFLLARLNADIVVACRNRNSAENLINEVKNVNNSVNIEYVELDLNNFESVKKCIKTLKKYNGIDYLINNAGIYNVEITKGDSGFNNIFQVNFLYTYYLTKQLLSELKKKENSKCITVGSIAHNYSKINESDIDFSAIKKRSKVYGNSKRFLMFSLYELFKNEDIKLSIVHPGVTFTNMTSHYHKSINWLVKFGVKLLFPPPQKAALNIIYAMFNNTHYYEWVGPKIFNIWGLPKNKRLTTCSQKEGEKIFEIAENCYKKLIEVKSGNN